MKHSSIETNVNELQTGLLKKTTINFYVGCGGGPNLEAYWIPRFGGCRYSYTVACYYVLSCHDNRPIGGAVTRLSLEREV